MCRTQRPRSAMASDRSRLTRMFLDFKSRWAIAGLPEKKRSLFSVVFSQRMVCTTFGADDGHVEVWQPRGDRQRHLDHLRGRYHVAIQVVEQRPVFVVFGNQPQLRPRSVVCNLGHEHSTLASKLKKPTFVVGGNETEDILVPQHHSLVYFRLSEPRVFVPSWKYFDGNFFAPPNAEVNFAEPFLRNKTEKGWVAFSRKKNQN